jgi:histone-lysine N-methyltransferase SETMAR
LFIKNFPVCGKIREKNSRFAKEKLSFITTMHLPHKSVLAMGKLRDLHYEFLEHPPYSPGLSRSDFLIFPKLKLFLAGQHFSSNRKAIAAVEVYFANLAENHCRYGVMALEYRWKKCISLKGDYVKK